ncbi:EamA family transporter [Stenotrophomonas sp. YAU14A_MKIMI4_1]|uniref:EamA family transporter n=1 Tax=Stenotrophomonas sp. YAU14A_MKIMI4_1 TaxID=2072408 RepID=UPI000D542B57|nr:EamA family transporter [Stenotrophomonas sp. YAU14A_MKIMI4_1]AWH29251.1 EamA family transporter [Stenotrophomonas sp. YAU14A_MKIMI4_1]
MKNDLAQAAAAAGIGAIALSLVSQNVGAACAKHLFGAIGVEGTIALRIGLSALVLVVLQRAWRHLPGRGQFGAVVLYGLMLGAMNTLIYQAFARIPMGVAVGIEVLGPLAVGALAGRRLMDLLWSLLALGALFLLLPLGQAAHGALDPIGVLCAIGAAVAWGLYILAGKRASHLQGVNTVAWGMVAASMLAVPVAITSCDTRFASPAFLIPGLAVACLSGVLPYALEMWAMRRLSVSALGVILSTAPAVSAVVGWLLLGERLSALQCGALALIVVAMAGHALTRSRRSRARVAATK